MNRMFRVIWSRVKSAFVVVPETAGTSRKGARSRTCVRTLLSSLIAASLSGAGAMAATMPTAYTYDGVSYSILHSNALTGYYTNSANKAYIVVTYTDDTYATDTAAVTTGSLDAKGNLAIHEQASVSGGWNNLALASSSSVSGGNSNVASGSGASVSGGVGNTAAGLTASVSGGAANKAVGLNSSISGGRYNTANFDYASVTGGETNTASAHASLVAGGKANTASSTFASVYGGGYNTASNYYSSVYGGGYNAASGMVSVVSGGNYNTASANYSSVYGGTYNTASGALATAVGGSHNTAQGAYSAAVGGGGNLTYGEEKKANVNDPDTWGNLASGEYSAAFGGAENLAEGKRSATVGGQSNTASGLSTVVSGGSSNTASGKFSAVTGGFNNTASGEYSFVSGGYDNTASENSAAVFGGNNNVASGKYSSVFGGEKNKASGQESSVSGGVSNEASGQYAWVSGGYDNTASALCASTAGGIYNEASGQYSAVYGGAYNKATNIAAVAGGGSGNTASYYYASAFGGINNIASGVGASVFGGHANLASGTRATAVGGTGAAVQGTHSTGIAGGSTGSEAENALAAGHLSTVTVANGTAVGYQSTADEEGTIAFGHDAEDVYYTVTDGAVTSNTYTEASYNRLVKVGYGKDDHDAVVVAQLPEVTVGEGLALETETDAVTGKKTYTISSTNMVSGDLSKLRANVASGDAYTGNDDMGTEGTLVGAINANSDRIDAEKAERLGVDASLSERIEGLRQDVIDSVTATNQAVSDGFTALSNADAAEAAARKAEDEAINEKLGDADFSRTNYAKDASDVTGAVAAVDAALAETDATVGDLSKLRANVASGDAYTGNDDMGTEGTLVGAINTNSDRIDAEKAERLGADASLSERIEGLRQDVIDSVTATNQAVSDGFTALSNADAAEAAARKAEDDAINEKLGDADFSKTNYAKDAGDVTGAVEAIDAALAETDATVGDLSKLRANVASGDAYTGNDDMGTEGTLVGAINANSDRIDAEKAERLGADASLSERIEGLRQDVIDSVTATNQAVSDGFTALSNADAAEAAARKAEDEAINEKLGDIDATVGDLSKLRANVASGDAYTGNDDMGTEGTLVGAINANSDRIDAEKAERLGADASLSERIEGLRQDVIDSVTATNQAVSDGFTALSNADAAEAAARKAEDEAINEKLGDAYFSKTNYAKDASDVTGAITAVDNTLKDTNDALAAETSERKNADIVLAQRIDSNSDAIAQNAGSIRRLSTRLNKVGAGAAALAALHPLDFDPDAKWDFAAGYGNYRGAHATALGAFYRPNEDWLLSFAGSFGGGENMVNAGVSLKVGAGSSHVNTSKVAMAKEIKELRGTVAAQDARLAAQDEKIARLTALVNSLVGADMALPAEDAEAPAEAAEYFTVDEVTLADRASKGKTAERVRKVKAEAAENAE